MRTNGTNLFYSRAFGDFPEKVDDESKDGQGKENVGKELVSLH